MYSVKFSRYFRRGGFRGGAHPARAPLKLENIWFFGVKSWFFTRNTAKIFAPPSAIGKNMIFWRKIVIFHTKYGNNFRASLRNWKKYDFFGVKSWFFTRNTPKIFAQFFLSAPPLTWNPGSAPVPVIMLTITCST